MRQKNSYSRIIQDITSWETNNWGDKIRLFQHCVEKDITSFLAVGPQADLPGLDFSQDIIMIWDEALLPRLQAHRVEVVPHAQA